MGPAALRVVQATGYQGNNYNPQGNNYNPNSGVYNPQPTAPAHILQPAAPAAVVQPAYRAVPAVRRPSAAEVAASVASAAADLRRRVEEEAARQKEIARAAVQQKLDLTVATKRKDVTLQVAAAKDHVAFSGKVEVTPRATLVENNDPYGRGFARARAQYDKIRGDGTDWWDQLTGNKQSDARSWAQNQLSDISERQVPEYSAKLDSFLSEQAKRKQAIESAKFGSRSEFDKAVKEYTDWESAQISALETSRQEIQGAYDAYTQFSTNEVNAVLPNIGKGFQKLVQNPVGDFLGGVWKYTLGSGDENIPSLVTAPSRLINAAGNALDPNRTVYRTDGTQGKLDQAKNIWQNTFAQRNFNIAPVKSVPFDQWINTKRTQDSTGKSLTLREWINTLPPSRRDAELQKYKKLYENENRANDAANNLAEFLADPLFAASAVKALKIPEALGKSTFVQRFAGSAPVKQLRSFVDSVTSSKIVKWLGAEAKSPQQRLIDAITNAKSLQAEAQKILPHVAQLQKRLTGKKNLLDYGVFDDLATLTDSEAKMVQQLVGGKLDKAKWFQRGKFRDPVLRNKVERIAARWKAFSDQLAKADNITAQNSRFLSPNGRQYFARTNWIKNKKGQTLDAYDFTLQKTKPGTIQSAADLRQSQIDRLFKSDLENWAAKNATTSQKKAKAELDQLLAKYDKITGSARDNVEAAYAKTQTLYGRFRGFLDRAGPTALWKKSVLKYRPAWYVNNFLYNTQAAVLAGGRGALAEQFRLLRPKNFRAAKAALPTGVAADVATELGKGKLSRFGGNVENLSRIAAFRAAKKRGLSDAAALKRVDKYLFNYKTKNWERPVKALVPFWNWQKNLVKATAQLPLDRPFAAKLYNRLDREQQDQFNRDFEQIVPRLKELGYTDAAISQMRKENAKYFAGRLKVGGQYITTPFNPFSENGIGNLGVNPYLEALGEYGSAKDKFGRPLAGNDASFVDRLMQKFPQAGLVKKGVERIKLATGQEKPIQRWIGPPGSGDYGLTKEAQGYDPSKPNYKPSLDKSAKLEQDITAFLGVPRGMPFDAKTFLERKTMEKLKAEYFAVDWNSLPFPEQEARRTALFNKYGVTADRFYKGELARYDTPATQKIKQLKEEAFNKTKVLFEEYGKQPLGTRNVWATQKLRELVDSGYFATNPFLKSFDWTTPDTIAKAYKKLNFRQSPFVYAGKYFKTAESMQRFKTHEFWTKYFALTDPAARRQLLRDHPEFSQTPVKSEADIAKANFWKRYADATLAGRRKLLRENPQYNERKNWTTKMWDEWKKNQRAEQITKLSTVRDFTSLYAGTSANNRRLAAPVLTKRLKPKNKKLVFSTA